ncbi:hypothetical protein [Gimesia maris]|uniref:hypothetical protein n=1 Tax=Gimesia maris TaxID=122 RepID=UPI003A8C9CCE
MKWYTTIPNRIIELLKIDNNPESFKSKLYLLLIDKLFIGAIIAVAFVFYDDYQTKEQHKFQTDIISLSNEYEEERRVNEANRQEQAAKIQREFEKARLSKDMLPLILDKSENVLARSYILRSSLSSGLIDSHSGFQLLELLRNEGLSDRDVINISELTMPGGLEALAQQGTRLSEKVYIHSQNQGADEFDSDLFHKEILLWRDISEKTSQNFKDYEEQNVISRNFLSENLFGLYYLISYSKFGDRNNIILSSSHTNQLIGSLISTVKNEGPTKKAADFLGKELSSLNLNDVEDIRYALAIMNILYIFGDPKDDHGLVGPRKLIEEGHPEICGHLVNFILNFESKYLSLEYEIDSSAPLYSHQVPRFDYKSQISVLWGYTTVSIRHFRRSLTVAEPMLLVFVNQLSEDINNSIDRISHDPLLPKYYPSKLIFVIETLDQINTPNSKRAIQKLKNLEVKTNLSPELQIIFDSIKNGLSRINHP